MANCDPKDLMDVAACFACYDAKQANMIQLVLLCKILQASNPMASCDRESLMEDAKCFACLDQKQVNMISLQLLCEILQAGGGGGQVCNLCVEGADPSTAPSCDCSIYTRTDTGEMWYWRALTAEWVKFISNT